MKIALLVSSYRGGGAERVMVQLANGFSRENYNTHLVVLEHFGPYEKDVDPGVNKFHLNFKRASKAVKSLSTWLSKENPDILLTTQSHINLLGFRAKRKSKSKVKLIVRESTTVSKHYAFITSLREKFLVHINGLVCRKADGVVGTSIALSDDLVKFYRLKPNKVVSIYAPNITPSIFDQANLTPSNSDFKNTNRSVITMGRIKTVKGYDILIKAMSLVLKKVKTHLYILGDKTLDPAHFEDLQKIISDKKLESDVTFLGFDSNPYPYIKRAHVYVLSSRYEGLPGSLVQAMALGANIVSTDCESGPREILKGGKYGSLVPVDDVSALAEEIMNGLNTDKKPSDPKSYVEFTQDYAIEKWIEYFKTVLN